VTDTKLPGIGGHQSAAVSSDEWLTPPHVIDACGPFDLDPCAPVTRPWPTAAAHFTIVDDGLRQPWPPDAFVFCNPPYGNGGWKWLDRLDRHPAGGIALTFARTETAGFFRHVWRARTVTGLLFLEGRLFFHYTNGDRAPHNSGAPSVLVAYGAAALDRLAGCGLPGALVSLVTTIDPPPPEGTLL
jgi:hypothetical protein